MSTPRNGPAIERLARCGWRVVLKYAFLHIVVYGIPHSSTAGHPRKRSTKITVAAVVTTAAGALVTALISARGWK
jgi:hypothetical protein